MFPALLLVGAIRTRTSDRGLQVNMIMCAVGPGIDNPFSSGVVSPPPGGPDEWVRTHSSEMEVARWYYPTVNQCCDIFIPQNRINSGQTGALLKPEIP